MITPVEGMNFDAVWEERKMATAHTWSGIKIVWKGMEWIAQRGGLQIVPCLHHYCALSSLSAEPQQKWHHKLQVRKGGEAGAEVAGCKWEKQKGCSPNWGTEIKKWEYRGLN